MTFSDYWKAKRTEVLDRAVGEELAEIVWDDCQEENERLREALGKLAGLVLTDWRLDEFDELAFECREALTTHPADTGEETEG